MSSTCTSPVDTDDVYVIHSSMTTTLHYEQAPDVWCAFLEWAKAHSLEEAPGCGRVHQQPFRHLELRVEDGAHVHTVHVVSEAELALGAER